jgi:hypothetical protein
MRPIVGTALSASVRRRDLQHELDRLVQEVRIGDLRQRLATGEVSVWRTTYRRSGGRVQLELDDTTTLDLRLFWARRDTVAALTSMRFDERVGWIVVGHTTGRSDVTFYAWSATVTPSTDR